MGAASLETGELAVPTWERDARLFQALEAETDFGIVELPGVVASVVAIVELKAPVAEELLLAVIKGNRVGPDVDPEVEMTATKLVVRVDT